MELDPVVLGILSVTGAGMILAVLIVTLCVMRKKCSICKSPKSRHGENNYGWLMLEEFQDQSLLTTLSDEPNDVGRTTASDLKESVLSRDSEPHPTYQMALIEHPRVYAGEYYIGMSGESEVVHWILQ